jgi:hypothetical protein
MLSPVPFMSVPINDGSTWETITATEKGPRIASTIQPPEPSVANMASSANLLTRPVGSQSLEIQDYPSPSSPHRSSLPLFSPFTGTEAFASASHSLKIRCQSDHGLPLPSYFYYCCVFHIASPTTGAPVDSSPFPINTTTIPSSSRSVPVLLSAHIDINELLAHMSGINQPDETLPSYQHSHSVDMRTGLHGQSLDSLSSPSLLELRRGLRTLV